jgi:hypothetical protein
MASAAGGSTNDEEVNPVSNSESYQWTLNLYEEAGTCWIAFKTTAPFRAQQDQIVLYFQSFPNPPLPSPQTFNPPQPGKASAWEWADVNEPNPFNTQMPWGSGWCAAWIAQASPNAGYVYVVQTPVTGTE